MRHNTGHPEDIKRVNQIAIDARIVRAKIYSTVELFRIFDLRDAVLKHVSHIPGEVRVSS